MALHAVIIQGDLAGVNLAFKKEIATNNFRSFCGLPVEPGFGAVKQAYRLFLPSVSAVCYLAGVWE